MALSRENLEKAMNRFNGCPLFEGREKGSLDDLADHVVTVEDLFPLNDYHCIIFEEIPDHFFLTGGALKELCNEFPPDEVRGTRLTVGRLVKTKSRREYRPITIIG